jgi:anti-sigma regulatory factor (Ser/Thr protein kinase)
MGHDVSDAWEAPLTTVADVTAARLRLRAELAGTWRTGEPEDDVLLAFEELASNALRHGGRPVRVTVAATSSAWHIEVSDSAPHRPPVPAVGRDAAEGGLGLYLVARLSSAHGWWSDGERKHVWARLPRPASATRPGTRGRVAERDLEAGRRDRRAG